MARFVVGLACLSLGVMAGTAGQAHAEEIPERTVEAAHDAQIDPQQLQDALDTLEAAYGHPVDAYSYLYEDGALERPYTPPAQHGYSVRVQCIIRQESQGNPSATNARSGAAGLGQFLRSTWLTTPQGKAGYSPYNAVANEAAIEYMLNAGRALEFDAVRYGGC